MDSHEIKRGVRPNGGSDESETILSEIRHTRGRMDHTLDELGDKLQPRHLVEDAVDYFWTRERSMAGKAKQSTAQMGRKVIDEVRHHPLPALLIGAGVVWLLSQQRSKDTGASSVALAEGAGPGLKEKAQQAFGAVKDKLGMAKEKFEGGKESFKERSSEVGEKAREKFGSAWEGTREKSLEMKEKAKGYYQQTSQTVRQTAETHPLALGVASLAAGLLAGAIAPRTHRENEVLGEVADRIKEEGKRGIQGIEGPGTGKEAVHESFLKPEAQPLPENLKPEG